MWQILLEHEWHNAGSHGGQIALDRSRHRIGYDERFGDYMVVFAFSCFVNLRHCRRGQMAAYFSRGGLENQQIRQSDGDKVLRDRDDRVFHFQGFHQSLANMVTCKGPDHGASSAKQRSYDPGLMK